MRATLTKLLPVAALAVGLSTMLPARAAAVTIIKGPYLQNVTQTSVVVLWETDTAATGRVDYGPTAAYGWSASDPRSVTIHEVNVTGLKAGATYHYRAVSGGATSGDSTFHAAPLPGAPVRICNYADSFTDHLADPEASRQVVLSMINSDPEIVLHTGDIVADGRVYEKWWSEFFSKTQDLMIDTPMFPILGNHEYHADWYFSYFSLPTENSGTEDWYSHDYSNVHIIGLDSNQDYSPGSTQYEWLVQDLTDHADAVWTIVHFHHPVYSACGDLSDNNLLIRYLVPVFEAHDVDLVFNGHHHYYEHSQDDGVHYIISGGGGQSIGPTGCHDNPYQVYTESCYHHCVIDVGGGTLTVRGKRRDNTTFDTLTLTKGETATSSYFGAPGWQLVSVPLVPVDPRPATVFAGISVDNALCRYDSANGGYVMYQAADAVTFGVVATGGGYWLHTTQTARIQYQGLHHTSTHEIELAAGRWTLIGHPFLSAVPLSAVQVYHPALGQTKTLAAAEQSGWIDLPLYYYSAAGGYQMCGFDPWCSDNSLRPWRGYWVLAGPASVRLRIAPP